MTREYRLWGEAILKKLYQTGRSMSKVRKLALTYNFTSPWTHIYLVGHKSSRGARRPVFLAVGPPRWLCVHVELPDPSLWVEHSSWHLRLIRPCSEL